MFMFMFRFTFTSMDEHEHALTYGLWLKKDSSFPEAAA
jgi:hypothetical protein